MRPTAAEDLAFTSGPHQRFRAWGLGFGGQGVGLRACITVALVHSCRLLVKSCEL